MGAETGGALVSVAIANYNNGRYLTECIDSVARQSYRNLEIVAADDCSTDDSLDTLEHFSRYHPRLIVLRSGENIGVSRNRHRAVRACSGRYVVTLDSDDYFLAKDKIEEEMEVINSFREREHKEVIAFSNVVLVSDRGEIIRKTGTAANLKEGYIFDEMITRRCMIPRDFLMLRSQYFSVGGYDPSIPIYEDWDLKIRLAARYEFHFTGIDGIGYRRHGEGLSSAPRETHRHWLESIFRKNFHLTRPGSREKVEENFARAMKRLEESPGL
jgi:glycosyltransferase involved in cell wall biosynthesis